MTAEKDMPDPSPAAPPKAQEENAAAKKQAAADTPTTGENMFGKLRFALGEVFILFFTAVIAYNARHQEKWGSFRNPLQVFQKWFESTLRKLHVGELFAGAAASTMVTYHGGNLFAPVMKWLHDSQERIVNFFNRNWGKPGELERGQAHLQKQPKQTWGDVIKGRIASFTIVFSSFVGADALLGVNKATGKRRFDIFEDKFARMMAWFTPKGREISKTPFHPELKENVTYRFGRILAIDIFATTASLLVWTAISKFCASLREKKHLKAVVESADPVVDIALQSRGLRHGGSREESGEARHSFADTPSPKRSQILAEGGLKDHRTRVLEGPAQPQGVAP